MPQTKLITDTSATSEVDLIINCFERTYRKVLSPGFVANIIQQNCFSFRNVTLLLNNINVPEDARKMAQELLESKEITQFFFVSDYLEHALEVAGLTHKKLGKLPFYSDWALVALVVPGSDWIVHWDADVYLTQSTDWISPSLQLMESEPSIAVANPCWPKINMRREERGRAGDFILGYGFTDQIFLLRRSEFARPIYRHWVPISMRFPIAHIGPYFEQWVDAYLRIRHRLRATYLPVTFIHSTEEGDAYPSAWGVRLKSSLRRMLVAGIRRLPCRHPYLSD